MSGFKKIEDKIVKDEKRRRKLDEKGSSVKPGVIEKKDYYIHKKRGDAITDNIEETRNVQ